ncbi:MAG: Aspartate-semialdehyde dehydrogenase [Phycisphaerae bacterium]|nr:Aspartate-semialdehyde dehydrogenase [Phycisphaerae bacterium]
MRTVAIVGATGAVGAEFGRVLERRRFPADRYVLLASRRSAGTSVEWLGRRETVRELTAELLRGVDLALFSAGASISREYAPAAAAAGTLVVDNSSAFRMDSGVPLVVPEVNPQAADAHRGIIANPNCSTIIMAVPLWPLHRANRVRRVVVSTYQAVSGAGARAMEELRTQTADVLAGRPPRREVFAHPCAFNVFSHNSAVGPDGLNLEETKLVAETRRIFDDPEFAVAPTCMRVPVLRAHLENLTIEFSRPIDEHAVREILAAAPGVCVVDDRAANHFPMPIEASGRDEVLVGRIRSDPTIPERRGIQLTCCGDQLLKGAALNAVQIAELVLARR